MCVSVCVFLLVIEWRALGILASITSLSYILKLLLCLLIFELKISAATRSEGDLPYNPSARKLAGGSRVWYQLKVQNKLKVKLGNQDILSLSISFLKSINLFVYISFIVLKAYKIIGFIT